MSASPNRLLAVVFGTIYVLIGMLGLTVSSASAFFAPRGGLLLGVFEVNAFQNVVHILAGAALLLAGISHAPAAKRVNAVVGAFFLLLGIVGLFVADTAFDMLALNAPDHVLHLATAVVLLAAGLGADRVQRAPDSLN